MSLPTLPATIAVEVNGVPQSITGKPNKEGTRIWYSGARVVDQRTTDPAAALKNVSVSYGGEVLKRSDPHVSAPQVFRSGHPKAGQAKPNTGGNWTTTSSGVIDLAEPTGTVHRFTLMVTVTYVVDRGFVVSAKAIPQAVREPSLVGDVPAFI